jgi:hypothetical protein
MEATGSTVKKHATSISHLRPILSETCPMTGCAMNVSRAENPLHRQWPVVVCCAWVVQRLLPWQYLARHTPHETVDENCSLSKVLRLELREKRRRHHDRKELHADRGYNKQVLALAPKWPSRTVQQGMFARLIMAH